MSSITYESAGVNISAGNEAVERIKAKVEKTFSANVIGGLGGFGALYDLKALVQHYDHPVLCQSIDGVGTKTIVARMAGKFDTLGYDLLSATSNDILVMGARTLTLLDYIANDKLQPSIIEELVGGMCAACIEQGVSLVGGETAEMPDTYMPGEHDLVGIVTGIVDKSKIIDGARIKPGDKVYAFASSGLHTNGYSLARALFFKMAKFKIDAYIPELQQTLAEALLAPHINYAKPIHASLDKSIDIKGMAHITGGGLIDNIPRVLPNDCAVEIALSRCPTLPIFKLMQEIGSIPQLEMYRSFNMGVGLVIIMDEKSAMAMQSVLQTYPKFILYHIGEVVPGKREALLL
ncbi:MAG: phosphoribosylformylglycinamidine cyclo-ligase [Gammaproteobacteria bacterium]|nr:phosphoribosylformylglycinamidine cyclo-ligase [Gammaproteobacteria bacterium]